MRMLRFLAVGAVLVGVTVLILSVVAHRAYPRGEFYQTEQEIEDYRGRVGLAYDEDVSGLDLPSWVIVFREADIFAFLGGLALVGFGVIAFYKTTRRGRYEMAQEAKEKARRYWWNQFHKQHGRDPTREELQTWDDNCISS